MYRPEKTRKGSIYVAEEKPSPLLGRHSGAGFSESSTHDPAGNPSPSSVTKLNKLVGSPE